MAIDKRNEGLDPERAIVWRAADAMTLEANAAQHRAARHGESYQDFLTKLAQASGIKTPTRADLARIDPKQRKTGSKRRLVARAAQAPPGSKDWR